MAWRRPAWLLALAPLLALGFAVPASAQDAVSYQVDAAHSGRLVTGAPTLPLAHRWSRDFGSRVSYPLVVGSRVFVTALDGDAYGPLLYALDLATGAELWSRRLGGDAIAVPGYHAGRVIVEDDEGLMRAYDAATGERAWAVRTSPDEWYPGPPVGANGLAFADGKAIDVGTGVPRWTEPIDGWSHPRLVVSGSRVLTAGECRIRSREQATGASAWVVDGLCGGSETIPVAFGDRLWIRSEGYVWPFDLATGQRAGDRLVSGRPPAFTAEAVFTNETYALVARRLSDGAELWRFAVDGRLASAPLVAGDYVYIASAAGTLYALRTADGVVAATTALGGEPAWLDSFFPTAMNAGRGHILVPLVDGRVVVLAGAGAAPVPAPPPAPQPPLEPIPAPAPDTAIGYRLDPARTGALPGPDPAPPLQQLWSTPLAEPSYAVVADGRLHVVDGPSTGAVLRTFDPATGAVLWSRSLPGNSTTWLPLWHRGHVVVQSRGGDVAAFDAATGTPQWAVDLTTEPTNAFSSAPTAAGDTIYAFGAGSIRALDLETGAVRWTSGAGQGTPALADGALVFTGACHAGRAYSAVDGHKLWGTASCGAGGRVTAAHDGRVYTRTDPEFHAGLVRRVTDGVPIDGFNARKPPALGAGLVVTANRRTLEAHDEETGVRRWRVQITGDAYTELGPPILVGSTAYSVTSDGRVFAVDADTGAVLDTKAVGAGVPQLDGTTSGSGGIAAGDGVLSVSALDRLVVYGSGGTATPSPSPTPTPTPTPFPTPSPEPSVAPTASPPTTPAATAPRSIATARVPGADAGETVARAVVHDLARRLRGTLRRRGLRSFRRLPVAPTEAGRLAVRVTGAGRRLARGSVRTSPTAATTLRLRLAHRRAHPPAVVERIRYTRPGALPVTRRLRVRLR